MFILSVYWYQLLKCDLEVVYLCCLNWLIKRKTSCSFEDVIRIGQFRKRRWKETFMALISPETDLILTESTCLGGRVYGQKPILSHMSVFWIGHLVTSTCKSWPKFTSVRNTVTTINTRNIQGSLFPQGLFSLNLRLRFRTDNDAFDDKWGSLMTI